MIRQPGGSQHEQAPRKAMVTTDQLLSPEPDEPALAVAVVVDVATILSWQKLVNQLRMDMYPPASAEQAPLQTSVGGLEKRPERALLLQKHRSYDSAVLS